MSQATKPFQCFLESIQETDKPLLDQAKPNIQPPFSPRLLSEIHFQDKLIWSWHHSVKFHSRKNRSDNWIQVRLTAAERKRSVLKEIIFDFLNYNTFPSDWVNTIWFCWRADRKKKGWLVKWCIGLFYDNLFFLQRPMPHGGIKQVPVLAPESFIESQKNHWLLDFSSEAFPFPPTRASLKWSELGIQMDILTSSHNCPFVRFSLKGQVTVG